MYYIELLSITLTLYNGYKKTTGKIKKTQAKVKIIKNFFYFLIPSIAKLNQKQALIGGP